MTFCFRGEVLHQKCNSQSAKDRQHKDDKRAPRTGGRMGVRIIRVREPSEKHQIMKEADEELGIRPAPRPAMMPTGVESAHKAGALRDRVAVERSFDDRGRFA